MEEMEPKELSYVIVPSDRYANTIRIYKPKDISAKESYNEGGNDEPMGIFDNIDLPLTEPEAKENVQEEQIEVQEAKKAVEEPKAEEAVIVEEEPKVEDAQEEPKQEEPEKEEEEKAPEKEEKAPEKSIDDMS